jgi:hypothetical protein
MATNLMLLVNDDWGRMWKETDMACLKVPSWNLEGFKTTKDLRTAGFPAKDPTRDSPETEQ